MPQKIFLNPGSCRKNQLKNISFQPGSHVALKNLFFTPDPEHEESLQQIEIARVALLL